MRQCWQPSAWRAKVPVDVLANAPVKAQVKVCLQRRPAGLARALGTDPASSRAQNASVAALRGGIATSPLARTAAPISSDNCSGRCASLVFSWSHTRSAAQVLAGACAAAPPAPATLPTQPCRSACVHRQPPRQLGATAAPPVPADEACAPAPDWRWPAPAGARQAHATLALRTLQFFQPSMRSGSGKNHLAPFRLVRLGGRRGPLWQVHRQVLLVRANADFKRQRGTHINCERRAQADDCQYGQLRHETVAKIKVVGLGKVKSDFCRILRQHALKRGVHRATRAGLQPAQGDVVQRQASNFWCDFNAKARCGPITNSVPTASSASLNASTASPMPNSSPACEAITSRPQRLMGV